MTINIDRIAELEAKGVSGRAVTAAKALLDGGPERVVAQTKEMSAGWLDEKDRGLMDEVRVEVLEALAGLRE